MDKILVTLGGGVFIGLIYWFFFGKKEEAVEITSGEVDITVDGGYQPSVIKLRKGSETTLRILRKDPNSCLEEIVLPDFKIKKYLPLGKTVEVTLTPEKAGEFPFHCGMNMFHGKIVVS